MDHKASEGSHTQYVWLVTLWDPLAYFTKEINPI